ncbi:MAG: metallophosphoesterase family protein [Alphaproteobacteria bacterium]
MTSRKGDLIVAHSSDLHVDDGYTMRAWGGDGNGPLAAVIDAAYAAGADILLLAGDVFEHNRLKADILDRTHALLSAAPMPVVMLPGNHDPLTPDSVWYRGGLNRIDRVHVLGTSRDTVSFAEYDLDIWGQAHSDYGDMPPLEGAPDRVAKRHIVAAHGHYVAERPHGTAPRASWLMTPDDIDATEADYVALGHWNVPTDVGTGEVPAHYSGSPDYAETINLVRFRDDNAVSVESAPVKTPSP